MLNAESASQRQEAARQLIRIGYDELVGYLDGGIEAWAREYPIESITSINVQELRERLNEVTLLDVRRTSEWNDGHIAGAIHMEGGRIAWDDLPFPKDKPLAVQCASGNRSMIASSVLRRRGFHNLIHVEGGMTQWKMRGFEVVNYSNNKESITTKKSK